MKKAVAYLAILLAVLLLSLFLSPKNNPPETDNKKIKREKIAEVKEPETEWVEQTEAVTPTSPPPLPFPVVEAETPPNPLPVEWEESFFDILDNSKSREDRNSRLYLFASTTAQTSPRVQEECLAHLSFGIDESEKEFALQILKDLRISEGARLLMFENLGKVRSDEFIYFLASNISTKLPESGLKKAADKTLTEFEPFTDNASKSKNKEKQPKWDNKKP
jgi:hypothetical protein